MAHALSLRGARTNRPQSTRATQCRLGVDVSWANAKRSSNHRRPRLDSTNTARGRQRLRKVSITTLDFRGARPTRVRSILCRTTTYVVRTPHGMDLARLCCGPTRNLNIPCILPVVLPLKGFLVLSALRLNPVARSPRAFPPWSKDQPPTEHARHTVRTWRGCVVGERGARFSSRRRPRLDHTNTARGRRQRLRKFSITTFDARGVRPARFSVHFFVGRPHTELARRIVRPWRSCVVGQHGALSSACRRLRFDRTNTAIHQWHGL